MTDYKNLVEPPTVPLYRPGQEPDMVFINSRAVRQHDSLFAEPREELYHHVDEYVVVTCPICDWSQTASGVMNTLWEDYDMHISRKHRGSKMAYVTVNATPRHAWEQRDAGRHFRRNVQVESIELLDMTANDDGSYTATFTLGKWRGDIPNDQLSRHLNDRIEFDAFDTVNVRWEHDTPMKPIHEHETIEHAKEQQA